MAHDSNYGRGPYGEGYFGEYPYTGDPYGVGPYGGGPYGGEESPSGGAGGSGFGDGPFGGGPFGDHGTGTGGEDEEDHGGREEDTEGPWLPETGYFGGGKFGQGLFGWENDQMSAVREAWDSGGIELHPSSNVWSVEHAITAPLAFISDDLVEINKAHHIDTAVDGSLDRMGVLLAVYRHTGESDARYRLRIKSAFQAAIADTTHEAVLAFIANLLSVETERIDIDRLPNVGGTAKVSVYQADLDAALITIEDLAFFATQVVPAGHRIIVELKGTFQFDDGDIEIPPSHGFSDADFEGGTFSESIS